MLKRAVLPVWAPAVRPRLAAPCARCFTCSVDTQRRLPAKSIAAPARRRFLSTTPPAQRPSRPDGYVDLGEQVAEELKLPRFRASADRLTLIEAPKEFFETLKRKIASAESSIHLSSLYIGKSETELLDALRDALRNKPKLQLFILVDALRSTREPYPLASGASTLLALQLEFPTQVKVHLWQTPKLSWVMRLLGKRFNEGAGLQHMKVYAFDNDVILSGANLAKDYFTNRRDRYILIENHPRLLAYLRELLHLTARFSYTLTADSAACTAHAPPRFTLAWPDGTYQGPRSIDKVARDKFIQLRQSWRRQTALEQRRDSEDTTIVPLVQMGPYGIQEETSAAPILFRYMQQEMERAKHLRSSSSQSPRLDLTSGYFSLYEPYQALVLATRFAVRIIAAAPQSNGFFGSKGISGYVADAYTKMQIRFWNQLKAASRAEGPNRVEIREWRKEGWTYHAKGFWLSPAGSDTPHHTLLGSSNYGARSAELDLECTLLISTRSEKLQKRFKQEVHGLTLDANDVFDDQFIQAEKGKVGRRNTLFVRVGTIIIRKML